jgi:hypothetical protein
LARPHHRQLCRAAAERNVPVAEYLRLLIVEALAAEADGVDPFDALTRG